MPGPGIGGMPNVFIVTEEKTFTAPTDKLVSGFVIINVRNTELKDINLEYSKEWDAEYAIPHNHSPNQVSDSGGTAPFYEDDEFDHPVRGKPPKYPTSEIFDNGIVPVGDPGSTNPKQDLSFPSLQQTYQATPGNDLAEEAGDTSYKWGVPVPRFPFPKIEGRKYTQVSTGGRPQVTELDWSGVDAVTGDDSAWFGDDGTGTTPKTGRCFYFYSRHWKTQQTDGDVTGAPRDLYNNGRYKLWFCDLTGDASGHSQEPDAGNTDNIQTIKINHYASQDPQLVLLVASVASSATSTDGNAFPGTDGNLLFESVTWNSTTSLMTFTDDEDFPRMKDGEGGTATLTGTLSGIGVTVNPTWEIGTCEGLEIDEIYGTKYGFNYGSGSRLGGKDEGSTAVRNDKELGLGDYDCYLYFVTMACHIDLGSYGAVSYGAIPYTTDGVNRLYHHDKCQSFIKSHLISRINNASDCNAFISATKIGLGQNPASGSDKSTVSPHGIHRILHLFSV